MSQGPSRVRKKTRPDIAPCMAAETESSVDRIHELLSESDPAVRRGLARNPAVPQESLAVLAEDFPDDVLGNPTLHFLMAASPSALWAWPTPSLVAMVHSPHADPALLALLLQSFTVNRWGSIEPSNRLELLDALLASEKLPARAVASFLSRAPGGNRRARQLEDAAMHAALQPSGASVEDALTAVTTCLSLGEFRHQPSIFMVRAIQDPNLVCRAVVRGLDDSKRIAASLVTGGVNSPLFKDFFSDRSKALLGLDRTVDPAGLFQDSHENDVSPVDQQEHLEWLESSLARRRASALLSRFATTEQLRAALQFERRSTVRSAAEEGLRRATYGCDEEALLTSNDSRGIKTIQAIVRWPQVTGHRLSKVVEAVANATWSPIDSQRFKASRDGWRRSTCLALLARDDLSEADMEILATSDLATLVVQWAHSTRTMLRHVIRQSHSFEVRVRASWHPNADPRDVAWLRSPAGLLESIDCARVRQDARMYRASEEEIADEALTSTDPVEYARRTKGQKVGHIERILALALKQCPKDMLLLRAKSDCWIERLLVAAHSRTPDKVRTRLMADSCWAVAVVAKDARTLNPTAAKAPVGTRAKAQSQCARGAARFRRLMAGIQKRLSSPSWEVVRDCIREVVEQADTEVLKAINKGITFTIESAQDGERQLRLKVSDKSMFRRSVKTCFRHEAALELVRAQIGPEAPLLTAPRPRYRSFAERHKGLVPSDYSELRKSLRDVDGLPSFDHYAGNIRLILDDCGSSWANRAIPPVPGLERVIAVLFNQAPFRPEFLKAAHNLSVIEGHIPVLPRLPSVRSVSGMVETTVWIDSPVTFIQELTNLERLNLDIHGHVSLPKGREFTFSLHSHPQLRELCLYCPSFSRFSMRLAGNSVHLRSLTLGHANVVVEQGVDFPNLESLTLVQCAPVPESLLGCASLRSLRVEGDLGLAQLNLVSERLERVNISDNKDLQTVERLLPHGRLETVELDQCHSLRAVDLGRSMDNLKRVSIRNCNALGAVSLPDFCPSLEEVLIHKSASVCSADSVLGRLPSDTPIKAVGFTACTALEDIDALARFPSIERIDLRGCTSIRSVAALKALGPSLRLQMFGAVRAKGEADLAPGVVSRRLGET